MENGANENLDVLHDAILCYDKLSIIKEIGNLNFDTVPLTVVQLAKIWGESRAINNLTKLKESVAFCLFHIVKRHPKISISETRSIEQFLFRLTCETDLKFVKKCGIASLELHLKNTGNTHFLPYLELIQGLDETQIHLVSPVLHRFDDLMSCMKRGPLNCSCFMGVLAFYKAMQHCNGWIALSAIQHYLSKYPFTHMLKDKHGETMTKEYLQFFCVSFLPLLNVGDHFLKLADTDHCKLDEFVNVLSGVLSQFLATDQFFVEFLTCFATVITASAPAYFISLGLKQVTVYRRKPVEANDFAVIRTCLRNVENLDFQTMRTSVTINVFLAFLNNFDMIMGSSLLHSLISVLGKIPDTVIRSTLLNSIKESVRIDGIRMDVLKALVNTLPVCDYPVAGVILPALFSQEEILQLYEKTTDHKQKFLLLTCKRYSRAPLLINDGNPMSENCDPVDDMILDLDQLESAELIAVLVQFGHMNYNGKMQETLTERALQFLEQYTNNTIDVKCAMMLQLFIHTRSHDHSFYLNNENKPRLQSLWIKLKAIGRLKFGNVDMRSSPNSCTKLIDEYNSDLVQLRIACEANCSEHPLASDISNITPANLASVLHQIKDHLHSPTGHWKCINDEELFDVLNACIAAVQDSKGHENYTQVVSQLSGIMFSARPLSHYTDFVFQWAFSLLNEAYSKPQLAAAIASSVYCRPSCPKTKFPYDMNFGPFWKLTVQFCLFGPIVPKGYRVYRPTYQHIKGHFRDRFNFNDDDLEFTEGCTKTREFGVLILLHSLSVVGGHNSQQQQTIITELLLHLMDPTIVRFNGETPKLTGNFSFGHRLLNRRLQVMLLLVKFVETEDSYTVLFDYCIEQMGTLHQQPSTRHLIEWILMLLLMYSPQLTNRFYDLQTTLSSERSGCIVSWLSVLCHNCLSYFDPFCKFYPKKFEDDELRISKGVNEAEQFLPHLLAWCTTQVFTSRCLAIACLRKLWATLEQEYSRKFEAVIKFREKYSHLSNMALFDLEKKNAAKYIDQLQANWFLNAFHPIKAYNLTDIFSTIPHFCGWPEDECGSEIGIKEEHESLTIPFHSVYGWAHGVTINQSQSDKTPLNELMNAYSEGHRSDFQKKIVPNVDEFESDDVTTVKPAGQPDSDKADLILVASLLDKPYNVGGLSRTSEIFGVSKIVVDKASVILDHSFVALSVSSHNHIQFEEIKRGKLHEYLAQVKTAGYTVVAAEQTSASRSLIDFTFPDKTALLLGNEKEGVPIELFDVVDVCVQIPQLGITRSLNVHVSGALLLYEFAKQKKFVSSEVEAVHE